MRNGKHGFGITAACCVLALAVVTHAFGQAEKAITQDRFLLLDSRIIATTENAKLEVGTVTKHKANPLFTEDKPWEMRFDNLYGNVIYDQNDKIYKCWYSPFTQDRSAKGMSLQQRQQKYNSGPGRTMSICYATSKDGIAWEKPELDLVDYKGSKANNIIWTGPHGAGIFKDAHETDSQRRYKLVMQGVKTSTSSDGLHWATAEKQDAIGGRGDTHNNAFWAPTLDRYVLISRSMMDIPESDGKKGGRARVVSRSESPDFKTWTKAEDIIKPDVYELQPYAMSVFYHAGVYIGILAIHHQPPVDRVWPELAWSIDTKTWHRVSEGTPLIPLAEKPLDYDYGCIYACITPIIGDGEIRIYYGASDYLHFGWRTGSLALATLRPDGFAGYVQESPDKPTVITTTAIAYANQTIRLSADIAEGGSIAVSILDPNGKALSNAEVVRATVTDGHLKLNKPITLKTIRLRFELKNAKLYSFSLAKQ
ncbi:MAG: hypothetical protein WD768_13685 [Phycisphaeraceae bacterium]